MVNVSIPATVARVPVVGKVTVPLPAIAFAFKVVVPDVEPAKINFVELKVLAPVTVCIPANVISPLAAVAQLVLVPSVCKILLALLV